jgi:hypothetical protein
MQSLQTKKLIQINIILFENNFLSSISVGVQEMTAATWLSFLINEGCLVKAEGCPGTSQRSSGCNMILLLHL